MTDGGRTTLGELARGDVFRTEDGLLWRRMSACPAVGGELVMCSAIARESGPSEFRADTVIESLDLPALLKELDELRTLTHDLLIDRDAAYGREVGRGEAARAVCDGCRDGLPLLPQYPTAWHRYVYADNQPCDAARIHALGPVRPLPPQERLAARCRALEDALRGLAGAVEDLEGVDQISWSPQGQAARKAAIGAYELLKENSSHE